MNQKIQSTPRIEISHKTIIFTVGFLASLYLIYLIRNVLVLLFISFMVSVAISPMVRKLKSFKVPEGIAIALAYAFSTIFVVAIIAGIVPPLVTETTKLFSQISIPTSIVDDIKNYNIKIADLNAIASQLNSIPKVLGFIGSAFAVVTVVITVGVMSYYLLKGRKDLHKNLQWIFGHSREEKEVERFVDRIEDQIGSWVRGEFALMVIVGLCTYFGLTLLNINFAVPLALIAGLFEVLPNIGPIVSAIPAVAIALMTGSPPMALAVTALYILIQQLENTFIVPYVMRKAVGIDPVATIVLILIGLELAGIGGAALAIPVYLSLKVVLQEYLKIKKLKI